MAEFEPGQRVVIVYSGYTVEAKIIEKDPLGRFGPQRGWYLAEQITDYEDVPSDERPRYLAAAEYITLPGEPLPAPPLSRMASALWGEGRTTSNSAPGGIRESAD